MAGPRNLSFNKLQVTVTLRSECHEAKRHGTGERKKEEGINIFNSSSLGAHCVPKHTNTHTSWSDS